MTDRGPETARLIERLLADPELRSRFRADPDGFLGEHDLAGLDAEQRSMLTLELRESRSSLAGLMVATAAEGVDFAHLAEHAAPGIERGAGGAIRRLIRSFSHHSTHHTKPAAPPKPSLGAAAKLPVPPQPIPAPTATTGADPTGEPATAAATPQVASTAPAQTAAPVAPATPSTVPEPASNSTPTASGSATTVIEPSSQPAATPQSTTAPTTTAAAPAPTAAAPTAPAPAAPTAPATTAAAPTATPTTAPATPPTSLPAPVDHHPAAPVTALPEPVVSAPTSVPYPGDSASPQAIAEWMGAAAVKAGLPPELPVMAALTESGLHNLSYGDRDSVGFFQMRVGIWNTGEYAGYPQNPDLQLKWFIDHALAVKQQNPSVAGSSGTYGDWVADVEQPAAQYRGRYAEQLATAQSLLKGLDLAEQAAAPPASAAGGSVGQEALAVAMRYMGTPYHWGGSSPSTGFDCSGLVQYAYAREGVQLPRVAADQFHAGVAVPRDQLEPGDAVFFADSTGYVHHVGLYVGDGKFINAPQTGEDVKVSSLSEPYFAQQYAGARRFVSSAAAATNYARTLPTVSR